MKKIGRYILCSIMIGVLSVTPVMAANIPANYSVEENMIRPYSLQDATCTLNIDGFTATCRCSISALGASSITATLSLEKLKNGSWETVKERTYTGTYGIADGFTKLITAGTFRAKLTTTAVKNGVSETITAYTPEKTK